MLLMKHFLNSCGGLLEHDKIGMSLKKILKKYDYFDSKLACTPYDTNVKLFKNTSDNVRKDEYVSIICSLKYTIYCIRSNIAYVTGFYIGLLIERVKSIVMLLEKACNTLKGPWILIYIIKY